MKGGGRISCIKWLSDQTWRKKPYSIILEEFDDSYEQQGASIMPLMWSDPWNTLDDETAPFV